MMNTYNRSRILGLPVALVLAFLVGLLSLFGLAFTAAPAAAMDQPVLERPLIYEDSGMVEHLCSRTGPGWCQRTEGDIPFDVPAGVEYVEVSFQALHANEEPQWECVNISSPLGQISKVCSDNGGAGQVGFWTGPGTFTVHVSHHFAGVPDARPGSMHFKASIKGFGAIPEFSLAISADCNSGLATGLASLPATLIITGNDAAGNAISMTESVEGQFSLPIAMTAPEELTDYPISLNGQLSIDGITVATADFSDIVTCGEPQVPTGSASCSGATLSNPNLFDVNADVFVDGVLVGSTLVPTTGSANVGYEFTDTAVHVASANWSGNGQSGSIGLGTFGPCGPEPEPDLYTITLEATCASATATGFAAKTASLIVSGIDAAGEPVSYQQEVVGDFNVSIPLTSPEELGEYEVSLTATLTGPTGGASDTFNDVLSCGQPAEMCHGSAKINFDFGGVGMKPGRYTISGQGMNDPVPSWTVSPEEAALYAYTGGPLDTQYQRFSLRERRETYVEVVWHGLNGEQEKLVVLNWAPDPAYQGVFGWISCDLQHSIEVAWPNVVATQAAAWTVDTDPHVVTTAAVLGWDVAEAVVVEETAAAEAPAAVVNDGTYTVQAGDVLANIAYAAGQDWRAMAEWNGLEVLNGNIVVLSIGQVLTLVPPSG